MRVQQTHAVTITVLKADHRDILLLASGGVVVSIDQMRLPFCTDDIMVDSIRQ